MKEIKRILKHDGRLIMTTPFGKFAIFRPWHKVYDTSYLSSLLSNFKILKEKYFIKKDNYWILVSKETASKVTSYVLVRIETLIYAHYALACLLLKPR